MILKICLRNCHNEEANLYDYWGDRLYHSVLDDSRTIINLASKEYSKCIERYLSDKDNYITITFCELSGDKLITKGTYAKMAAVKWLDIWQRKILKIRRTYESLTGLDILLEEICHRRRSMFLKKRRKKMVWRCMGIRYKFIK